MPVDVIALPGAVAPGEVRYRTVVEALGSHARVHPKELELYAGESPPAGYSIDQEVQAVAAFADSLGLARFHLLAYSGGGFIALAFAGAHPERLLSLALFEPASIPGPLTAEERVSFERMTARLRGLSGAEYMREFNAAHLRPGVPLPPPPHDPPPPWMAKRPAGISALMRAFDSYRFDRDSLRGGGFPVFLGHGDLSDEQQEIKVGVLSRLFDDIHVLRLRGVHHFVPPEQLYGAAHLAALRGLWSRAAT